MSGPKPAVDSTILIGGVPVQPSSPAPSDALDYEARLQAEIAAAVGAYSAAQRQTWQQAAWFIDPVNGNDAHDGATSATAVRSWQGGVLGKLGTQSPLLTQDTRFTFLSTQTDANDVVTLTPFCQRCTFVIEGQRTLFASGVLGAVTAKNRAAGQVLTANLSAIAPAVSVGQLIVNTTRGSSVAFISNALGAGVFELTQPQDATPAPCSAYDALPAEVNTWVIGDAVHVYALPGIFGGVFEQISGAYIPPDFWASTLHWLHFLSLDGPSESNVSLGANMSMAECWAEQEILETEGSGLTTLVSQCLLADVQTLGDGFFRYMLSGAQVAVFGSALSWAFENDALVDCTAEQSTVTAPAAAFDAQLSKLAIRGVLSVRPDASALGFNGAAVIWGAAPGAQLNVLGTSRLSYPSAPNAAVATFVNIILTLNNQTSANAFNPTTGAWSAPIALTAANLDTSFGGGGFGGLAINVGGASITNQATP